MGRRRVLWLFKWQDEPKHCEVLADSDWGGNAKERRSASGGVWMLGMHLIKTWSATQRAYALSSDEAELYAMVEAVTRAKGLVTLAYEVGFRGLCNMVRLSTDSSAAKSFVSRRGLGRMRHLQIRDLWLQKEIREGRLAKFPGPKTPPIL